MKYINKLMESNAKKNIYAKDNIINNILIKTTPKDILYKKIYSNEVQKSKKKNKEILHKDIYLDESNIEKLNTFLTKIINKLIENHKDVSKLQYEDINNMSYDEKIKYFIGNTVPKFRYI